jgi:hypothetical protein
MWDFIYMVSGTEGLLFTKLPQSPLKGLQISLLVATEAVTPLSRYRELAKMSTSEKVEAKGAPTDSGDSLNATPDTTSYAIGSIEEADALVHLGYKQELSRNRSMFTLLFQSLAIAAIPYGEGSPLMSAIYGGGQLAIFLGWVVVCLLDECIALSLSELASKYPTSAGPYYWSFQIASRGKTVLSFVGPTQICDRI